MKSATERETLTEPTCDARIAHIYAALVEDENRLTVLGKRIKAMWIRVEEIRAGESR